MTEWAYALLLASFLVAANEPALAQSPVPGQPVDEQKPPVWNATSARTIRLFPAGDIYPAYIADPHRPTNAIAEGWRLDSVLQGGLVTWSSGHSYRLFVQWADGRVPLGQFAYYSEASFSLGLKIDM